MSENKYTIIDLFAGTSALSEGFVNHGFVPLSHIEMDKNACDTIRTRVAYHYLKDNGKLDLYYQYLKKEITRDELYNNIPSEYINTVINKEISEDTIPGIFEHIEKSRLYNENGKKVDFIVGGPPCQAYSMLVRHKKDIASDARCFLYKLYGRFLEHYNPMGFVFENVVGIISAAEGEHYRELQKLFNSYGYHLYPWVLQSNNYGVLQKRKRLIIIGWRDDVPFDGLAPEKINNIWSTKDVFSDLSDIQANSSSSKYKTKPTEYLKRFNLRTKDDVLTWHESRPLNDIDRQKYLYAVKQKLEHNRQISYLEFDESLQTMKKVNAFTDRFKVVDPNGFSQTVVAHLAKDGHYYIYPSLEYVRSISVREAARLQSFPDNFYFEGTRCAAFKQIGNAVPPLLSEAIAEKIINSLQSM